jgi:hypothetical protein
MTLLRRCAPVLLLLVLSSRTAHADGLSAPSLAVNDGYNSIHLMHLGITGGSDGVAAAFTTGMAFEYVTYTWNGQSLEVGAGARFHIIDPLQAYVAAGGIIAPLYRPQGGGRVTGGISAQFGDTFFVRPGAAISFGLIGEKEPPTYFLPMEVSVELGYMMSVFSIYARLSGGLDALQPTSSKYFGRFAASLGIEFPIPSLEITPTPILP